MKRAPATTFAAVADQPPASPGNVQTDKGAAGNWKLVIQTPAVTLEVLASLEQEADRIVGTIAAPTGPIPANGTMIDDELKLEFVLHLPDGDVPVAMTGKLGPAGFAGRATLGRLGEGDWTGTRVE